MIFFRDAVCGVADGGKKENGGLNGAPYDADIPEKNIDRTK